MLRWIYARRHETLTCELSLDSSELLYELVVRQDPQLSSPIIERHRNVNRAFSRQCEMEGEWIRDGWSLQDFTTGEMLRARVTIEVEPT